MAGRFLLCLVLLCVVSNYSECKRYGSSSSGRSSGSSWGRSKPSSSSSSGSRAPTYPSSPGLSGYGSGKPTSYHTYPPSPNLSGSGSGKPTSYHTYPPSPNLSGNGSRKPTSYHTYPPSPNLSGYGGGGFELPAGVYYMNKLYPSSTESKSYHSSNTNTGYGTGHNNYGTHNYGSHGQPHFNTPSYYTAPQHVYITEYRNSGSRYKDLLAGLALYNMGRSHSYHDNFYYNDDYYRGRYHTSESSSYDTPTDEATCTLRIKEDNKVEVLKIPCEIVSTFTEGSKKAATDTFTQKVCVSNYTLTNNTAPATTAVSPANVTMLSNGSINGSPVTVMNSTKCTIATDPLTVKGPPANPSNMECEVDIDTKDSYILRSKVDCSTLLHYAKMPEPKKEQSVILPPRSKLKSWLANPPWWLSLFIAV
ncbi:uncharacterized protein [Maniola hyperantus]|uniref:uncharacterized protein n=1 Tax=Aphantopus hyperantus TaxID=2795564 RepID=UPI0021303B47